MKIIRSFLGLSVLLGIIYISSLSQSQRSDKRFVINTDYCRFWKDDSTGYLEISTAVYPGVTIFKNDSSGLHGKIEIRVDIQNKSTNATIYTDRFNIPLLFSDSLSFKKAKFLVHSRTYSLECGTYLITVIGTDSYDRSHCDSAKFVIDILRKPGSLALSDIELCSNISASSDQNNSLYKNSYIVVPQPSCVFGSTTSPIVFTYTECYNGGIGQTYTIESRIVDQKGSIRKNRIYQRRFMASNIVDITSLNVTSLLSGKYDLVLLLSDSLGRELASAQRVIYLHNPQIKQSPIEIAGDQRHEFSGMTLKELEEEFRTAQYIAQPDEIKTFEKLTTVEAYREFIRIFWTRLEADENNRTNLTREVYRQRVLHVNQQYGGQSKEGWRSDRGRVYLLYGEPDEIQRYPNFTDSRPYEIWSYHQLDGGVEFVFVDLTGFNEYTLVHSTKRGEIMDYAWEKLLRRDASSINPGF
jgi:GWxTD domain-containing protein